METKLVLSDLMVDMLKQVSTEDRGKRELETQKGSIQKVFCRICPYKLAKILLAFSLASLRAKAPLSSS